MFLRCSALTACCLVLAASPAAAHPVPRDNHDRTIVVHLDGDPNSADVTVRVNYRLEVDPFTVVYRDLAPFKDEVDFQLKGLKLFEQFTSIYAPILANHLTAEANGQPLTFTCSERGQTLVDDKGESLGHLRCDFVFRARFTPIRGKENRFRFVEGNYELQEGRIDLALATPRGLRLVSKIEPDAALKARGPAERLPEDEDRLRNVSAVFLPGGGEDRQTDVPPEASATPKPPEAKRRDSLLLLLSSEYGLWTLLLLASGIGAVHALTPGHGKTLVAAYLVGQQGTVWHAILLGLITTLTHTGVVLVLAAVLYFGPADLSTEHIQMGLGLAMGLAVACLGFFLLLRRLSGKADHVHIGGGHHHHHGQGHDHVHAPGGTVIAQGSPLSTLGLVVLGISGGIIPCWDAIVILLVALGSGQLALALPLLLAFSAGLAGVLVLIGILVVQARNFATSKLGEGRLIRALPILSALFVTLVGVWLCYESVYDLHD